MNEIMLKRFGILSLIGAIIALIAFSVPALLTFSIFGTSIYLRAYWFFGLSIHYAYYSGRIGYIYPQFSVSIFGILVGTMLLVGGIITIIYRRKIKEMGMDPKIGGITILICGIISIFSIVAWLISRHYFYSIGPGIYLGIIGSVLITISGILALKASKS